MLACMTATRARQQGDDDAKATPEVDDVVEGVDGLRGIVRAVHPNGYTRVASHGDLDEGVWVKSDHLTVVHRPGATPQERARRAKRASERRPRNSRVAALRVDRDVWNAVLKLADGDASRIEIISETEVRVR